MVDILNDLLIELFDVKVDHCQLKKKKKKEREKEWKGKFTTNFPSK